MVAKDQEHAQKLDAADGQGLNGKYFGAPILSVKPKPTAADASIMPSSVAAEKPVVPKDSWRRDPFGYDFPMLEEVVKISDHGRQLTDAELAEAIKKRAKKEAEADKDKFGLPAPELSLGHDREPRYDDYYDEESDDYSDGGRTYDYERDLEVRREQREAERRRQRPYGDHGAYDHPRGDRYDAPFDNRGAAYDHTYNQPYDDRAVTHHRPYDSRAAYDRPALIGYDRPAPSGYDRPALSGYDRDYDSCGGRY